MYRKIANWEFDDWYIITLKLMSLNCEKETFELLRQLSAAQ